MSWPYQFLDLSQAEKHARRQSLDKYALYAQLSALIPIGLIWLYQTLNKSSSRKKRDYTAIPSSDPDSFNNRRQSNTWSKLRWWLGEDVVAFGEVLGQRGQWVFGLLWSLWLLVLCIAGTGTDYMHLTKRFGIVAISQYPMQYLLTCKSFNPVSWTLKLSHEETNRWHRVLARVTTFLLSLHTIFYYNYFIQNSILLQKLQSPVVLYGILSFAGLNLMITTALRPLRKLSYRVFFITHLLIALGLPAVLWFHASSSRKYLLQSLGVFLLDIGFRKRDTITVETTISSIPGTSLIKIDVPVPRQRQNQFLGAGPGGHVYVNVPPSTRSSFTKSATDVKEVLFEFMFNPFTIAHVDHSSGTLTLVARQQSGPMTTSLARFATSNPSPSSRVEGKKALLNIEGPYGAARHFPSLSLGTEFDRVLLIAGGVGATFTIPLYRSIISSNPEAKVEMVWAVRTAGEATWAVVESDARDILNDPNVHIYLTGPGAGQGGQEAEAGETEGVSSGVESGEGGAVAIEMRTLGKNGVRSHQRRRPDLKKVVDEVFAHGKEERVAVLVCGPVKMGKQVRRQVGRYVKEGREVWFHNEGFGF
ncbi:ferric reductase like transmembrane component-domain-containing protein [Sordaria brevicollis]|uniref:Ferric reductase like transmembrane component-domain-containing protein n=1 Tax=Sordaria brevicollis TaxID=83679 RepID=A0AAE0UE87_SORBR|nr:ferric reductase like transmembrane component-domain-containing protein [Sordaria brevicollis]